MYGAEQMLSAYYKKIFIYLYAWPHNIWALGAGMCLVQMRLDTVILASQNSHTEGNEVLEM